MPRLETLAVLLFALLCSCVVLSFPMYIDELSPLQVVRKSDESMGGGSNLVVDLKGKIGRMRFGKRSFHPIGPPVVTFYGN